METELSSIHKPAGKKMLRVNASVSSEGRISRITITGDFFMHPEEAVRGLEEAIIGAKLMDSEDVRLRVDAFFKSTGTVIPGMSPSDFSDAVLKLTAGLVVG